jgi:hypothetical protein
MEMPIAGNDDDDVPKTIPFDTLPNYPQTPVVGSSSSPFQTPVRNGPVMTCPNCGTETGAHASVCWGCSNTLTPVAQATQAQSPWTSPFAAPAPNQFAAQQASLEQARQWSAPFLASPIAAVDPDHARRLREFMLQQQRQQQQNWFANQQQLNRTSSNSSGFGTSSNPIALDDDTVPVLQNHTQFPSFGIPRAPLINNPFLNNGWTPQPNPFAPSMPIKMDPSQYLNRVPYDYPVPNPSQDDIKELLANIRPDEDIKIEDTDAIIPGLASHMRLMKHQQVLPR